MKLPDLKYDCRYFSGEKPCSYHISHQVECAGCGFYRPIGKKILIIKLGARGDVIRTTPLLHKLIALYPDGEITWLTQFPEVLPRRMIRHLYTLDHINELVVLNTQYDIAINLEKEMYAGVLLNKVTSKAKYGFSYLHNNIYPVNNLADHKYFSGISNTYNKAHAKSYIEEIFNVCDLSYTGEKIIIDIDNDCQKRWDDVIRPLAGEKKRLLINTGAGQRWATRIWPQEYIIEFIEQAKRDYFVIIAGGNDEHEKNQLIQKATGAYYSGLVPISDFFSLINTVDIVLTGVTMALHIAIGLNKKIILLNNIFNRREFDLYGSGIIIEPSKPCDCFYGAVCIHGRSCMYDLPVDKVMSELNKLVKNDE